MRATQKIISLYQRGIAEYSCGSQAPSHASILYGPRRLELAREKQIKFFTRVLRESKTELNSAGNLTLVISIENFKKLLDLCVRWSEVKNWLNVCTFISAEKTKEDDFIQRTVTQELFHWSIHSDNLEGMNWILSHKSVQQKQYPIEVKNSRKFVETVCISSNGRMQLRLYHTVLAHIKGVIEEHKMINDGLLSLSQSMNERNGVTLILNDWQHLSRRLGPSSVSFCRKGVFRLLFRVLGTVSKPELSRHQLFRTFVEWMLISNPTAISYLFFEDVANYPSSVTRSIMKKLSYDSYRISDKEITQATYWTMNDGDIRELDIGLLTQYAYLLSENDSPYFLTSTYEQLCAKNLLPFVLAKNHLVLESNLEAVYYLCCLCAISSLPQCIALLNQLLSFLWNRWKKSDSASQNLRVNVQKSFPKLFKQSKEWKHGSDADKCAVSSIIRSFVLAASAEYVSPKDVEIWQASFLKKESIDDGPFLPCDSHFGIFDSIPSLHIPPFFSSVSDFLSLLGPKVTTLLVKRKSKISPISIHENGSLSLKISHTIFYARYGMPKFIERFFLNPRERKEPISAECVLYENSEVIMIHKLSGTNIAPTSKVDDIRRIEKNVSDNTAPSIPANKETEGGQNWEKMEIFEKLSKVPRYGIIHRIDNEASGIIMFAKTCESYCFYKNLFFQSLGKTLIRKYIAILHFYRAEESPSATFIHEKYKHDSMREHIHALGLRSSIIVNPLEVIDSYALVRITLFHGMRHAIRRMVSDPLASFRNGKHQNGSNCGECVILGETLYGTPGVGCTALILRLALHAESLNIPLKGITASNQINVEASMPADMLSAWTRIRTIYCADDDF